MNTRILLSRLKPYLGFAAILAVTTSVGGVIATVISGSDGYAGLGVFIAMPVAQFLHSSRVLRLDPALGLLVAAPPSVLSYYATLELVSVLSVSIESNSFGLAKFLTIYGLISIVYWEAIRGFVSARRGRTSDMDRTGRA